MVLKSPVNNNGGGNGGGGTTTAMTATANRVRRLLGNNNNNNNSSNTNIEATAAAATSAEAEAAQQQRGGASVTPPSANSNNKRRQPLMRRFLSPVLEQKATTTTTDPSSAESSSAAVVAGDRAKRPPPCPRCCCAEEEDGATTAATSTVTTVHLFEEEDNDASTSTASSLCSNSSSSSCCRCVLDDDSIIINNNNNATTSAVRVGGGVGEEEEDFSSSSLDPYADVRHVLEQRSLRDKSRYAWHDDKANASGCTTTCQEDNDPHYVPWLVAYTCYLAYAVLLVLGHLLNFCSSVFRTGRYYRRNSRNKTTAANCCGSIPSEDESRYAPLVGNLEKLYTRRMYARVQDCFNRPVASSAGVRIDVLERVSRDRQKSLQVLGNVVNTGNSSSSDDVSLNVAKEYPGPHQVTSHDGKLARRCLNLGSYNYLGFADDWQETCGNDVRSSTSHYPISTSSSLHEYGRTALHRALERTVAEFLGKEDALILNMGFNTNATTLPALVGPGDLILSDELNHTSIVQGARASGAAIRIFKHQNMSDLEAILRQAIILGRPRTRRPWNRILMCVCCRSIYYHELICVVICLPQ